MLAGILTDRQTWGREPILYIGQNPLPEEAYFPDKYVSFDAMFDDRGDYRLKKQVETIYAKPPAHRTKPEQTLLKLDEKVNILYALLNGQMFPIFPVAGSQRWISPGDDRTEADTVQTPRLFAAFRNALTQTDPQAAGRRSTPSGNTSKHGRRRCNRCGSKPKSCTTGRIFSGFRSGPT